MPGDEAHCSRQEKTAGIRCSCWRSSKVCPLGASPAGKPILRLRLLVRLKDPLHIADDAEDANQAGIARDFDVASELAIIIAHGQVILFAPRRGLVEGDPDIDRAFSDFWLISSLAGV